MLNHKLCTLRSALSQDDIGDTSDDAVLLKSCEVFMQFHDIFLCKPVARMLDFAESELIRHAMPS
jgi:hypothetical protein